MSNLDQLTEDEIKQVFIKCHDNDFWNYYLHALKQLFDYFNYFPRATNSKGKIEFFIRNTLHNLYQLQHNIGDYFPWNTEILFNDEAIRYKEWLINTGNANSECAFMDMETYLVTPNAKIEDYIYTV